MQCNNNNNETSEDILTSVTWLGHFDCFWLPAALRNPIVCLWRYSQGKESLAEKKDFLGSWAKCRRWSEDLLVDERQISRLRPGKGWVGDWVSVGWISFGWVAKITKVGLGIFVSNLVVSAHKIFPQLSITCVGCGCGLWTVATGAVAAGVVEYVWLWIIKLAFVC